MANTPKWLYPGAGYINMEHLIYNTKTWRVMVYGGRGPGKTYGTFDALINHKSTFLYLRRTDTQYKIIANKETSPLNKLNTDMGYAYYPFRENDKISAVYDTEEDDKGKLQPVGNPIGYFSSVLSFHNVRGVDLSRVDVIVYDEFVAESHVSRKQGEFEALLNLYESINRNRELAGRDPCKLIMLANSDTVYNPYFIGWHLVNQVLRMKRTGVDYYVDPKGYYTLVATDNSPISAEKSQTKFYKELEGTDFYNMAVASEFDYKPDAHVRPRAIREYTPMFTMGELTAYVHKSRKEWYLTEHRSGNPPVFEDTKTGHYGLDAYEHRFLMRCYSNYSDGEGWKVYFENPENEIYFKMWYGLA